MRASTGSYMRIRDSLDQIHPALIKFTLPFSSASCASCYWQGCGSCATEIGSGLSSSSGQSRCARSRCARSAPPGGPPRPPLAPARSRRERRRRDRRRARRRARTTADTRRACSRCASRDSRGWTGKSWAQRGDLQDLFAVDVPRGRKCVLQAVEYICDKM